MTTTESHTTTSKEEDPPLTETDIGSPIRAMAFAADGRYLVSGDKEAVRVWQVDDLKRPMAVMKVKDVRSVAVSKDGGWIAAGGSWGQMVLWTLKNDGETFKFEEIPTTHNSGGHTVTSVDFSPKGSFRLVTASGNREAHIWELRGREVVRAVGPLKHLNWVIAAKFSPQGDRVATATFRDNVRVYDSRNGTLLDVVGAAQVTPYYNTGLLWSSKSTILILSNKSIDRINLSASSSSTVVREWSVPDSNYPCIVSPASGEFVLYAAGDEITKFYNPSSKIPDLRNRTCTWQLPEDIRLITLSPDGLRLAIYGGSDKLFIKHLASIERAAIRPTT